MMTIRTMLVSILVAAISMGQAFAAEKMTQQRFEALLHEVSEGWNTNDAGRAAAAFAPDAIYSEPPDKQLFVGRDALFEFFGGADGRTEPMEIIWRHIVYNPETQIGAAEWTFLFKNTISHGVVMIRIKDGLIGNWREYYYDSDLDWEEFQGGNKF